MVRYKNAERIGRLHPALRLQEHRNLLILALDKLSHLKPSDHAAKHAFIRSNEWIVAVTSLQACLILEHPRPAELVAEKPEILRDPKPPGSPGKPRKDDQQETNPFKRLPPDKRLQMLRTNVLRPLDCLLDLQAKEFLSDEDEDDRVFAIQQAYTYCSDIAVAIVNLQACLLRDYKQSRELVGQGSP